jgi:two-component system LytT family sensor kinase
MAGIDLLRRLGMPGFSFRDTLLYNDTTVGLIWLALPAARWAAWRYALERTSWWRVVLMQGAVGVPAAVFVVWGIHALRLLAANRLPLGLFGYVLRDTFAPDMFVAAAVGYVAMLLPFYAADFYRNWQIKQREAAELQLANAQLETRLVRASLDALKMQLHPHFLFNTLNTITALIRRERTREAEDVVAGLGELLRRALEHRQDLRVPLGEELKFLRHYFAIESIRFQDRLRVEFDIAPACHSALVPSLILQPLVENAMKHGFSRVAEARLLRISARVKDRRLLLAVYNDGPALSPATTEPVAPGRGIGTQNTRMRLDMMYGDAAEFRLRNSPPAGVSAEIELPFQAL